MSNQSKKHPLKDFAEIEKIAYLSLLASICYIDKDFSEEEKKQLDLILIELDISKEGRASIYSAVFNLRTEEKEKNIKLINDLNSTVLKYTLNSDWCLIGNTDSNFSEDEYIYIMNFAEKLEITKEQVDAIKMVQENLSTIKDISPKSEKVKKIIKESSSKLAGTGVPIAAIAASGSVFGLSASGITSGLAALGGLVGGGMVAGAVIVVPTVAIAATYGVKKILDIVWKDKK